MASIEESICDAIDVIVNRAVETAGYDKTVQATIVACIDATVGKYKCRYQDSVFYAYSTSSDVTYSDGTSVYVLIPGNDMSQDKTILGATKKLGIDYVTVAEGEDAYEVVGTNVISSTGTFTFSSYKEGTQVILLYSKDNSDSDNLISIDATAIEEYFKQGEVVICGGVFRTELPTEQQYRGNYGLIFALDFLDNTENQVVTRYYTVDVDNMTGNPYKLITDTRQYGIFDIDAENFIEINYISAFCYDFPNSLPNEECVDDIFISGIEMSAANRLSDDELASYVLTFVTPQGTYFMQGALDSDTLTIQGQVRVKGQVIDNDSQSLPFYWGIEDVGVTSQSEYYCKYLGQGWKCLNDYNIIERADESDPMVVEWVPGGYQFKVTKGDFLTREIRYKCAVIYDNTVLTKTITIKNLYPDYEISIESDSGTQFYFDIGYPTLTCVCTGDEVDNLTYSWAVTNNVGTFETISETPELNDDYNALYAEYIQLLQDIEDEVKQPAASAATLEGLERSLKEYETITRVEGNKIFHLNVNTITTFSTYQCTVYRSTDYIGTASITLLNTLEVEGVYSLVINDGCYAYKYNESGISPASNAVDSPIEIKALTFTIYDNLGQPIDDEIAQHCDIQWVVPTENTLLKVSSTYDAYKTINADGTATYKGLMSLPYTIADRYDITKQNNDICLTVVYKDMSLSAKTNLTFTKEGESGTNGTEYSIKIVPNTSNDATAPKYWIITDTNGTYTHNFTPVSSGRYLKVQMYHNENRVFNAVTGDTTEENKAITVTWSIQQNKYTGSISDDSSLSVTTAGVFTINGYKTDHPANIVEVTIVSEGVTYYATYPVITVSISNSDYRLNLKEGTGFQYAIYTSDGRSPKYDNTNPFEVVVERLINGYWEDTSRMSTSEYKMDFVWSYLGRIYDTAWETQDNLLDRATSETLDSCQHAVKPADSYDGQCVTNAVRCIVSHNNSTVGEIHIPVHLYLNRYGLAALNGWDGNSIEINDEGGFILSPQVGAGIKESDNSFTGVLIGAVKESGKTATEVGLFGYSQGKRSIFLNAEDGSATFGISTGSQIIIDPSSGSAIIRSGDYSASAGTGMEINFSSNDNGPYIRFGSGDFVVDSSGHITAKGGGTIAGFNITDTDLWSGGSSLTNSILRFCSADGGFSRSINSNTRNNLRIASGNNFAVDSDGQMFASYGFIGSGSNLITLGKSTNNSAASALYTGSKSYYGASGTGFYLGTDGFALGDNFSVTPAGLLTCNEATITGGSITINTSSGKTLFSVNNSTIKLGDFTVSANKSYSIYGGDFELSSEGYYYDDDPDWGESGPAIMLYGSRSTLNTTLSAGGLKCSQVIGWTGELFYSHFYDIFLHSSFWKNPNSYQECGNHPEDYTSLSRFCSDIYTELGEIEGNISSLQSAVNRLQNEIDSLGDND